MPLEQELKDLMLETVVLELATGTTDKFNKLSYDSPITAQCKIVRMNKQVLDRSGQETTSTVQIILADPTLDVTVNTRLTLPVGQHPDGPHPEIIEVMAAWDDTGPYYLEIRA